jgi:hypothetical protein
LPGQAFACTPVAAVFLSAGWRYIAMDADGTAAARVGGGASKFTVPGTVAATNWLTILVRLARACVPLAGAAVGGVVATV